jgi:hypothetical protein
MAKIIPTEKPEGIARSEEIIFDNLKSSPVSRWTVFPQFYTPNPDNPLRPRELDFVLLIEDSCSVVYLEAKGGQYKFKDRQWFPRGEDKPENPSPVEKAESGMFALKGQWENEIQGESYLSFLNAVAFTSSNLNAKSLPPDVTQTALLIGRGDARDPSRLVNRLRDYANQMRQQPGLAFKGTERKMALAQLKELEKFMRAGVWVTDTAFYRTNLESLLPELLELTPIQQAALDVMKANERSVIDGAAGTGKTVLAMESARQHCEEEGDTVALMCSNPNLVRRFRRWAETLSAGKGGRVIVGTPASLLSGAFGDEGFQEQHRQRLEASPQLEETLKRGDLDAGWEGFVNDTVADLDRHPSAFDFLIVDEAQNLWDPVFLHLMDVILKGGLVHGHWAMFGDFKNQNIVTPRRRNDGGIADNTLRDMGAYWSNFPLNANCRNTREIADSTSKICKIETPTLSGVHGPDVEINYFGDGESPEDLLESKIKDWRSKGFEARQIVLLSGGETSAFDAGRRYGGWHLVNIRDAILTEEDPIHLSGDDTDGELRYSDVYDFQGLESDLVILVLARTERQTRIGGSVTMPDYDHATRLLYTGMSRAKAMLYILADDGYKDFLEPVGLP